MYVMEMVFSPEIYAVMRLLLATYEEKISVPTIKTEIKAEKIIKKIHPDEHDAYTLIRQNLELYNAGCKAAVKKCVKQYIRWDEQFHLLENLNSSGRVNCSFLPLSSNQKWRCSEYSKRNGRLF